MENFEQVAVQYEPMIHKIIHSLHIYRNQEEFYQVGLIALWDAAKSFDQKKGNFTNYAYTFLKGRMLLEMNKTNKQEERCVHFEEEIWELIEDPHPLRLMEMETLQTYCEGLTEKETKWVMFTFIDSLTIREIAEKENVTVSAVKQWRTGALRRLRENLSSK